MANFSFETAFPPPPRTSAWSEEGEAASNTVMPSEPHALRRVGGRRCWTINGDFTTLPPNGVARYASEVTLALDTLVAEGHTLARDLDLELVVPRPVDEGYDFRAISIRDVPEFSQPRLPQFWVQAQLPWHVRGGLLSFCNLAPVTLRHQIACIHDMHCRLMPSSYGRGFRWAHRLILPLLGRRAARITTVSQFSRDQLVRFKVAPEDKIVVTYNGGDHASRWDAHRASLPAGKGRPYVLCLGRKDQEYKNMKLLVDLAPQLDDMGVDLWMPGDVDEAVIRQHRADMPSNLVLLGRIDDHGFKKALEGAICFLFPSRIEGFGLPAVEAMASGCPVVASSSPCLPEICGGAALYADPDSPTLWADAVRLLMATPGLAAHMVARGRARAREYSWRRIAEIYLELMMQVDAEFVDAGRSRNGRGPNGAGGKVGGSGLQEASHE
jgi:glycosyltransferase involved in cell wall biosynthesis